MNATTTVLQTEQSALPPDTSRRSGAYLHDHPPGPGADAPAGKSPMAERLPGGGTYNGRHRPRIRHVLCTHTGLVVAYGAVVFDGEPAYAEIDGTWLDQAPYVVLHRLAVAQEVKGQGIATEFMRRTMTLARERGTGSFRIDTNFDNRCMLRLLAKFGFVRCGEIQLRRRSSHRIQKIL